MALYLITGEQRALLHEFCRAYGFDSQRAQKVGKAAVNCGKPRDDGIAKKRKGFSAPRSKQGAQLFVRGVGLFASGDGVECAGFNGMEDFCRLAVLWHDVHPAARGNSPCVKGKKRIGERVAVGKVGKKPAVSFILTAECLGNFFENLVRLDFVQAQSRTIVKDSLSSSPCTSA